MATQSGAEAEPTPAAAASARPEDPIVQYVVLCKELWTELGWPLGPLAAQACHASVAAMWTYKDDDVTQEYCAPENIDHMTKVVLEAKGQTQLRNLSDKLTQAGINHKLWIEQPEDIPTCLACKPYRKSEVAPLLKKFNLCKSQVLK